MSLYLGSNLFNGAVPAPAPTATTDADQLLEGLTDSIAIKRLALSNNKLTGSLPPGLFRFRMQVKLCNKHLRLHHAQASRARFSIHAARPAPRNKMARATAVAPASQMPCSIVAVSLCIRPSYTLAVIATQTVQLLQELTLAFNRFTGPLPFSVDLAQDLTVLDVTGNQLTGPLPTLLVSTRMRVSPAITEGRHVLCPVPAKSLSSQQSSGR